MDALSSVAEADSWLNTAFPDVSRETWTKMSAFEALIEAESASQNLISKATIPLLRLRHVADSAQLLTHARTSSLQWLDLGSGAGFPGLIVAALSDHNVTLVESRRLRIEFLSRAAELLGVSDRVSIVGAPLERVPTKQFDVISARAFAPLERLLPLAHRFSTEKTVWILPKGRSAQSELDQVRNAWQGEFRLEPSMTDPDARIIVASDVRPGGKRRKSE